MSFKDKLKGLLRNGDLNRISSSIRVADDGSANANNDHKLIDLSKKILLEKESKIPSNFMLADTETSDISRGVNDNASENLSDFAAKIRQVHDIVESNDGNAELLKFSEDSMRFREQRVDIARELLALQSAREKYNKIRETNIRRESIIQKSKMVQYCLDL